ncbi:Rid family hydrolase [Sphingomonas arenae]|uniref:Rid family hydrolase n=1 Tax=Sphingomonas arenae TaxID=2812555 RepID=UPI001967B2E7|nr:Rid family hydrolase [Sphingomonas arenae]
MLSGPALAGERQRANVLMSQDPGTLRYQEEWGYADAVVSGDTIYLSGVVVGVREGGDPEVAFIRAFERIGEILKRAGASWDDAVEMTSYHTDLQTQMPVMIRVKNRFVKPPAIAWTAVEVSRLIPDRGITEIKVVAKKPG